MTKCNSSTMVDVIGGSGFIGTRFCRRLACQDSPSFSIIDKVSSTIFPEKVKITDVRSVPDLEASVSDGAIIVNLAAEHRDDVMPRTLYDEVNVDGAKNVCQIARAKNVRAIVFTSTVAVYGFAEVGTNESGRIAPFNDYGRTKFEAEQIYQEWQAEEPTERTLVIIRPTVVFGEQNRGNVYNLLHQIASGRFVMVGSGHNRKSMAYVENVAGFIEYSLSFSPGLHIYNYIDKPDFCMNELVLKVKQTLCKPRKIGFRVPYLLGYLAGKGFDLMSFITGKRSMISSIRVKKFCSDSVFDTSMDKTGFVPPVSLEEALARTIRHEFLENHEDEGVFYSE